MNKAEWDAMGPRQRDEVVALNLMGWQRSVLQNIYAQLRPPGSDECTIDMAPHYTTDRNACALVLDEIEKLGDDTILRFLDVFKKWCDITQARGDSRQAAWFGMRAHPNLICFCAVQAVPDE